MRVVLVSSPGSSTAPHWSQAAAAELAGELLQLGADVECFQVVPSTAKQPPPIVPGTRTHRLPFANPAGVHRVTASLQHMELERELARSLRREPAAAVVHLGAGARGSPNVLWLAERMGSRVFAVVRGAEIVCHRGDLIDAGGRACNRFDDAATCRACCTLSFWRRPHADEFVNRWDLLLGGLLAAAFVFVDEAEATERLALLGVAHRRLAVTHAAPAIAQRLVQAG